MAVDIGVLPGTGRSRGGFGGLIGSIVSLFLLSILFSIISDILSSGPPTCIPPHCSLPPPQQGQLTAPKVYTSSRYGFSVNYSASRIKPSSITDSSIAWDGTLSGGSEVSWSLTGMQPNGQSAQQIVQSTQSARFPDAQQAYTIPSASLGYSMGYGNVYDVTMSPSNGQSEHYRLLVTAVIRNGLAVVMVGLGPYEQSSSQNDSHPNPAATPLVQLGEYEENLNSVTWPGQQKF